LKLSGKGARMEMRPEIRGGKKEGFVPDPDKATQTQLKNIEAKTGKTLDELRAFVQSCGLERHGEIRALVQEKFGLGHGDANTLVHVARSSDGERAAAASGASLDDVVEGIYTGPKAALRPVHDRLMAAIEGFGEFEVAPKKGYVSLRRKRQFAMIGPATRDRVEVGLNMKGVASTARLLEEPPGRMCQYKVKVTSPDEVDSELVAWLRTAYESAG